MGIDSIHQSMVGMWLRCGVQFERRYIGDEIIPPGIAARRGSAFHRAVEVNHKQKMESKKDLPLGDLQDAARDEYVKLVKEEGVFIPPDKVSEKQVLLNAGLDAAHQAIEKYHKDIAPTITPKAVEASLAANIGFAFPIKGRLDLVEADRIRDFKVAGKSRGQEWADRSIQATFYCLLHKEEYGEYPKEVVYEEIVPLKTKTNHNSYSTFRDDTDVERMKRIVTIFMHDLKTGIFRPADIDHWMCTPNWCGYFNTCPHGKLQRVIK